MSVPISPSNNPLISGIIFVAIVLVAGLLIAFLKCSSDVPLTPQGLAQRDSLHRMARPDTTESVPDDTYTAPTAAPAETEEDSTAMDTRVPSQAGYEDGYGAGLYDGVNDTERASYDESSLYPEPAQRRNYAAAYSQGYEAGFRDGQDREVGYDGDPAERPNNAKKLLPQPKPTTPPKVLLPTKPAP